MRAAILALAAVTLGSPALAKNGPSAERLPADSVGGIYTVLAPEQVAACIAAAAGTTAQQNGASWSVAGQGNSFEIAEDPKSPVYRTVVVIRGTTAPTKISTDAIMCSAPPNAS